MQREPAERCDAERHDMEQRTHRRSPVDAAKKCSCSGGSSRCTVAPSPRSPTSAKPALIGDYQGEAVDAESTAAVPEVLVDAARYATIVLVMLMLLGQLAKVAP
jgi:hypothetical protein